MQHANVFGAEQGNGRADFMRSVYAAAMSGSSEGTLSRTLWTKALPGSAVVLAALTLPQMAFDTGNADARPAALAPASKPAAADAVQALAVPAVALPV